MISQLFILAPNGHTIVNKDYRGDVPKDSPEIFLRKLVEKSEGEAPIFNVDGVNYMCVRKNGLFFLATTLHNVPPAFVIELLTQLTKVCRGTGRTRAHDTPSHIGTRKALGHASRQADQHASTRHNIHHAHC